LREVRNLDTYIVRGQIQGKEIRNIRARCTTTYNRYLAVHEQVLRIEETYGIQERWTPTSVEYQEALVTLHERRYRRAVDSLERLVIQRLFELAKLGMSGVGKAYPSCSPVLDHTIFFARVQVARKDWEGIEVARSCHQASA
jgi:hypothetical protein